MLKKPEKLCPYDYQAIPLTGSVMRNSRLRIFLYVLLGAAMCCIIYVLKTTHFHFKEIESSREKCLQQRDSLSAQLQVVYEHKNRLEKSLQQEKLDHKHTKEEQDRQKNELRVRMEREKHTLESRYSNLLQEHEASQNKQQLLHNEIAELKNNHALLEEEKKQLVGALSAQLETLKQQKEEEIIKLKADIDQLILEKGDLQKNNENQIWRVKQHTDELQLCRLQYDQLEDKLKQLTAQIQRRPVIGDNKKNTNFVQLSQNNKFKNDHFDLHPSQILQIKKPKNIEGIKSQQIVQDDEKREKEIEEKKIKSINNNADQMVQPKLLQRPNLVSSIKAQEQSQSSNPNIHPLQNEEPNELEKPHINSPEHYNSETKKKEIMNDIDQKLQDSVLHPPNIEKSIDNQQKEEHLPQVQPPHSYDKAEIDHDIWEKYPKNVDNFEHHAQNPANGNNRLHQIVDIKDSEVQNEKQLAPEDIQERGVLIKPPLENNKEIKIGQDVEGLKRGPQMIDEKNGKHRQQEEDGDYAEDGDDDNADDQDGEPNNNDDQLMVGDHAAHANVFDDFDDQDNAVAEVKNGKEEEREEGVMVAPK